MARATAKQKTATAENTGPAVTEAAAPLGPVVTVRGPQQGRRRIGQRFGDDPVEIPLEDLTQEDLSALVSDPVLTVSLPDLDPEQLAEALRPSA